MLIKKKFNTKGMTCNSCEKVIAKQALKLPGVRSIDVDYATEKAWIEFDDEKISVEEIKKAIEEKGYTCEDLQEREREESSSLREGSIPKDCNAQETKQNRGKWGLIFIILGVIVAGYFILRLFDGIQLPEISQNMSYGLLFLVGLLTGFHCVSMCGGFVVSYTAKGVNESRKPHLMHLSYAVGKTLSYTIIGAVFGLIGSIVAFTPKMRGFAGIIAGLFLLLYGLKMLNVIPALRKFGWTGLSAAIGRFAGQESGKYAKSPLIIGLLNGLMIACGPLQALYVMAAGTGSMLEGAKILFIFALGTLPVMLGFGYLTSFISNKATHKILKASGVIVIILGLVMINRGLALTGSGYDFNSLTSGFSALAAAESAANSELSGNGIASGLVLKDGYQEIRMEVNRYGWNPNKFVLQKGVPVKWIIDGKELNGCNGGIQVPKLGLKFDLKPGLQTIEFTPQEEGTISWSCWMGMIPGVFIVKDNVVKDNADKDSVDAVAVSNELKSVQVPKGSSCGMGGGCGCGGARNG
ncbi:MAG: sulfite exporter TauE/SafE family protein [Nanoarchaeota archaeon]